MKQIYIVIIAILAIIIAILGASAFFMFFGNSPVEVNMLNNENSADIKQNQIISANLGPTSNNNNNNNTLNNDIGEYTKNGTPVIKVGTGKGPVTIIVAGVHGDQIPPQIAAIRLVNYLKGKKISGTVYIIPFAIPNNTISNSNMWNGKNPNQITGEAGSPTNNIMKFAIANNASVVGDFHSTQPGGNPGYTTVFCSYAPTYDSFLLAKAMTTYIPESYKAYPIAGMEYYGALEDELNLKGVPAITGVSTAPHGTVTEESIEVSFNQMISLLKANGNIPVENT